MLIQHKRASELTEAGDATEDEVGKGRGRG